MRSVSEMIGDMTRAILPWNWNWSGMRGMWAGGRIGLRFWATHHPANEGSEVNYDVCRSYYRNDGETGLGGGFAKPIVDLQVAFMGLPRATVESEGNTQFLNECLQLYWVDVIQQMFRDTIRDSKCIVRMNRPDVLDMLMTLDEAEHCEIEVIPPELVDIERDPRNKRVISRAVVHHRMKFVTDPGSIENGRDPIVEVHDVLEYITPQNYTFFDQTTSKWLPEMAATNQQGIVPLLEVHNEWDASLQGGTSDLETVIPFIRAFHEVLTQGLQAHSYHSTPKVVMKLQDIAPFIKNNMPGAVDPITGEIKSGSEIPWRGRELLILQTGEEVSFLEATSILGDSKVLLEFLIDCICIASQTPEWAFMRVDSGSANSDRNAQTVPFIKKVDRKRRNYVKPVQELLKMAMVFNGLVPERATISWETVRADDEVVFMQAFQQLVMALEVARERGEISDETYQSMIRRFVPVMKSNAQEFTPPPPPVDLQRLGGTDRAITQTASGSQGGRTPVVAGPQGRNE